MVAATPVRLPAFFRRMVDFRLRERVLPPSRLRELEAERVEGDARALPFNDASFDAVYIGQVPEPEQSVREAARVLKPGGLFADVEQLPDPHYVRYSRLLELASAAGLEPLRRAAAGSTPPASASPAELRELRIRRDAARVAGEQLDRQLAQVADHQIGAAVM